MLFGSGAAVFAFSASFVVNTVNLSSSGLKLRSASGVEVEHFGTTSVRKQLGITRTTSVSRVAGVSGPITSLSLGLRTWAAHLGVLVLDKKLRGCPFSADVDDEPALQMRSMMPIFLDDSTRDDTPDDTPPSTQLVRPLRQRFLRWRTITAAETGARRRLQRHSWGRLHAGQNSTEAISMVTVLHAVDI